MPLFGNITLGTRVFKPAGRDNVTNTVSYEDRSGGVPIGYPTLKIRLTKNSNVRRSRSVMQIPVLQAASAAGADGFTPAPRLSHSNGFTFESVTSNVSSEAERNELIEQAKLFVAEALLASIVVSQEEITG